MHFSEQTEHEQMLDQLLLSLQVALYCRRADVSTDVYLFHSVCRGGEW